MALRDLIQNAADAVQVRRMYENRPVDWGLIKIGIVSKGNEAWLVVEDNGIGMSENILSGPLLDFGTSFWRSPLATEEFPGLIAAGIHAKDRFGIGFFPVFMLGPIVRVYSRRCDKGRESGRILEFPGGTSARPILSPAPDDPIPIDGGTRVEVLLKDNPHGKEGLLYFYSYHERIMELDALVGAVAPNLNVEIAIIAQEGIQSVSRPGDWLKISDFELVHRLDPTLDRFEAEIPNADRALMQPLEDADGQVFGRAFISPSRYAYFQDCGLVTIFWIASRPLAECEGRVARRGSDSRPRYCPTDCHKGSARGLGIEAS